MRNGKTLDDSGFTDARFARQDRIVLTAAGENIDDLTNFKIASENRVDFSGGGFCRQIFGILVERFGFARNAGRDRRTVRNAGRFAECDGIACFGRIGRDRRRVRDCSFSSEI